MEIKIGSIYKNKTWSYLTPCLSYYGDEFLHKLNAIYKLAVGVGDSNDDTDRPSIYLLCDSKWQPQAFKQFLEFIQYHSSYIKHYSFDPDLVNGRKIMVVLKIPEFYIDAYDNLIDSKFSKMYTEDEVNSIFHPENKAKHILLRNPQGLNYFVQKANDTYNTSLDIKDFQEIEDLEYDIPFNPEEEIFNYNDNRNIGKNREW